MHHQSIKKTVSHLLSFLPFVRVENCWDEATNLSLNDFSTSSQLSGHLFTAMSTDQRWNPRQIPLPTRIYTFEAVAPLFIHPSFVVIAAFNKIKRKKKKT